MVNKTDIETFPSKLDFANVILVTGLSGAGATSVMHEFEDMGYYCIDKIPVALLPEFGQLVKEANSLYQKVAISIPLMESTLKAISILNNMDWINFKLVFLTCNEDELIRRYRLTRRTHPMIISGKSLSLEEAIEYENELANEVKHFANYIIDTTSFEQVTLKKIIVNYFANNIMAMSTTFVSFGYKHGVPKDADLIFDVRHLPNPFYLEELRSLTGNDEAVYNYVMEKEETKEYLTYIINFLDYYLVNFKNQGRSHAVIAIGCTGGQHRSVSIVNYLSNYYNATYHVFKIHREQEGK